MCFSTPDNIFLLYFISVFFIIIILWKNRMKWKFVNNNKE